MRDQQTPAILTPMLQGTRDPLSPAETNALIQRWQQEGDERARDTLVRANLRFVADQAAQFHRPTGLPLQDLVQAGTLGLLKAIDRFDSSRGFRLISYAVWWIRQSMQSHSARYSRTIDMPTYLLTDQQAYYRAQRKLWKAHPRRNRELWFEEVVEAIDPPLGPQRLHTLRMGLARDVSLDRPAIEHSGQGAESGEPWGDRLLVDETPDALEEMIDGEYAATVRAAVAKVSRPLDQQVLIRYYGLDGAPPATLDEIGRAHKRTRERIRQIKNRALEEVRQHLSMGLLVTE